MQNIVVCFSCSMKCLFCLVWDGGGVSVSNTRTAAVVQIKVYKCISCGCRSCMSAGHRETFLGYPCSLLPIRKSCVQLVITWLRANTYEDRTGTSPSRKVFLLLNNMWPWNLRNPDDVSLSLSVHCFSVQDFYALLEHPQDLQFFS